VQDDLREAINSVLVKCAQNNALYSPLADDVISVLNVCLDELHNQSVTLGMYEEELENLASYVEELELKAGVSKGDQDGADA